MTRAKNGFKRCGCGERCLHPQGPLLPATEEYFYRDRCRNDGWHSQCKACRSAKKKQRRRENPEQAREEDKRHRERHREKRIRQVREWRARNIEHIRAYNRRYKRENRDHYRLLKRARRAADPEKVRQEYRSWYEKNPDYHRHWRTNNRHKMKAIKHRRRAREHNLPDRFTKEDWKRALHYFEGRCAICGNPPDLWHSLAADHWIPLNHPDCPGTIPTNIVPLCHSKKGGVDGCNNIKGRRLPEIFLATNYSKRETAKIMARIEEYFNWVRTQKEAE